VAVTTNELYDDRGYGERLKRGNPRKERCAELLLAESGEGRPSDDGGGGNRDKKAEKGEEGECALGGVRREEDDGEDAEA
jgi:hypothetical protein